MRRTRLLMFSLIVMMALGLLITACPLMNTPVRKPGATMGTLTIQVDSSGIARSTIEPDLVMEIEEYMVTISGPGASQSRTVGPEGTTSFTALVPGNWTVTANAKNPNGVIIAADSMPVSVVAGETAEVDLTVVPLSGEGTLELVISWPEGYLANPGVEAILTPVGGSAQDISAMFILNTATSPDSLSYSGSQAAGYYELVISLKDGSGIVWSHVAAVRILAGELSTGQFPLDEVDIGFAPVETGNVQVTVSQELNNPYSVSLSGVQASMDTETSMTVGLSLDPTIAPDSIRWFINGVEQAGHTGSSLAIGPGGIELGAGRYRLDVLVHKGVVLGSQTAVFQVNEYSNLSAPDNLLLDALSRASIKVTWNDRSDNETGFSLQRSTSVAFEDPITIDIASNVETYIDTGLTEATTYYYRIRANHAAGNSNYSALAVTTTWSASPEQVSVQFTRGTTVVDRPIVYSIWIEDTNWVEGNPSNFIQNLYICNKIINGGLTGTALPYWKTNRYPASIANEINETEVDAVTSASINTDFTVTRSLRDQAKRKFTFYFEIDHSFDPNDWFAIAGKDDQPAILYAVDIDLGNATNSYTPAFVAWTPNEKTQNVIENTPMGLKQSEIRYITHKKLLDGGFGDLDPKRSNLMVADLKVTIVR